MKRVLVSAILDNGDEVDVSVRVEDGDLTSSHKTRLKNDVVKKLIPIVDDIIYFRIRYNEKAGKSKGKTESVKVSTVVGLNNKIDSIFSKIGVDN